MPSITNEQLKGNFAENLVAEWISRVCLVRSVTAGTDIGIDLYCESILENNPYLHFWVQVKAISEKDLAMKDGVEFASFRFARSHLEYWSRQPIPVYAFLVPVVGWPPKYPERIYALPITRYVVENGLPETDTVKLEASDYVEFSSINNDWEQFITKVVPADSAILLMSKGLVSNIDYPNSEFKHYPQGYAIRYSEEILDNVRDAVIVLGLEILGRKDDEFKGTRIICEVIASLFTRRIHELGVNFLVDSALRDKEIHRALRYVDNVQNEVVSRTDIDEMKKAEYIKNLENLKQRITE